MTRRRRIAYAAGTFVVALTIGLFLGGYARAAVPSPSPQSPPVPPAHDAAFTLGAALLLVFGMAAFALLCVGVLYAIEALREKWRRTEADMEALLEATREDVPDLTPEGRAALEATRELPPSREKTKAEMEAEFANHHAMVDKLRGDDRVGRMVRDAETELCEQLYALPTYDPETRR